MYNSVILSLIVKCVCVCVQLDDCALQLSHTGVYLDLESTLDEQRDELEGFQPDDCAGWDAHYIGHYTTLMLVLFCVCVSVCGVCVCVCVCVTAALTQITLTDVLRERERERGRERERERERERASEGERERERETEGGMQYSKCTQCDLSSLLNALLQCNHITPLMCLCFENVRIIGMYQYQNLTMRYLDIKYTIWYLLR